MNPNLCPLNAHDFVVRMWSSTVPILTSGIRRAQQNPCKAQGSKT